jgi:hypothetical protein
VFQREPQFDATRVKPLLGAVDLGQPSEPMPAITNVFALIVEKVMEQPSTRLQSLNSPTGSLGLVSNGLVVLAPLTL